jgi:glutamate racemase
MNRPIGIFDSGIGGLTVVKELMRSLPREDLVYFGDTARVPYGTKSPQTVVKFSIENALFLLRFRVKLIVVACNTSSSYSLSVLKGNFKVPVVGVISPGAREAAKKTKNGRIGIIGTNATINSAAYEREIKNINPRLKVFSRACPLFVPLVEEGWLSGRVAREVALEYLKPLKDKKIDTLVLGCTHYPLLKGVIGDIMGGAVNLVDSAKQVAMHVKEVLDAEGIVAQGGERPVYKFYVSDESQKANHTASRFLDREVKLVRKDIGYV